MKGIYEYGFVFNHSKFFRSMKCKIFRLLIVSVYSKNHYSWVNKLNGSWLDDLTLVPVRVHLCSVWHLVVGHVNSCSVGTSDNAARPLYWASIIIYCLNVNCMEFAFTSWCDFITWHLDTEKTFPFMLLTQVLITCLLVHQSFCGILLSCALPR
jgi:hypothetical protein